MKPRMLFASGIFLVILLIADNAYPKIVVRTDPRDGVLDASLVLVVRQVERDTFSGEEVFLGESPAGDIINLPGFRLKTEQEWGPAKIDPITPDTRILLFLKRKDDGWEITHYNSCYFWVHDPNKVAELRTKARQAVQLRKEWEEARDLPDQARRVEMLWPYLWDHGVSFLSRTQSELEKTGSVAGDYLAERLASLDHRKRNLLLPDLSRYGGERLHTALIQLLRDQKESYEQYGASHDLKSISGVNDWNRLPDKVKAARGELYYGLAGLADFKVQGDLPFIRELAEWSIENDCWQVCEAALQAFRYMPERENLPVTIAIWKRFGTRPPDGNGISPVEITRTLGMHSYPETVPLLVQFLGDEHTGNEARGFLGEIVGKDLGPNINVWMDWYNQRKDQEAK
jgi:hypothetical protein